VTGRAAPDEPLTTYPVPITPPPPPEPLPRHEARQPVQRPVDAPLPPIPLPRTSDWQVPTLPDPGPPLDTLGSTGGSGGGMTETARPLPMPPVIVGPTIDPRYADDFQPAYPPSEQRAGSDGRVVVRVLIGTDGRVKEVQRVEATSDAFYRVTEAQALKRWRFRPGTRDGVAQETWRTMSVTFVLADQ
jgi:protein TonB